VGDVCECARVVGFPAVGGVGLVRLRIYRDEWEVANWCRIFYLGVLEWEVDSEFKLLDCVVRSCCPILLFVEGRGGAQRGGFWVDLSCLSPGFA
jgi:hypothetical protein